MAGPRQFEAAVPTRPSSALHTDFPDALVVLFPPLGSIAVAEANAGVWVMHLNSGSLWLR